jgi:hypothetical protein
MRSKKLEDVIALIDGAIHQHPAAKALVRAHAFERIVRFEIGIVDRQRFHIKRNGPLLRCQLGRTRSSERL